MTMESSQVDGSYLCPKCNFPMCEEMCAFGEEHSDKECAVFAALDDKINVDDFEDTNPIYWNVAVVRGTGLEITIYGRL